MWQSLNGPFKPSTTTHPSSHCVFVLFRDCCVFFTLKFSFNNHSAIYWMPLFPILSMQNGSFTSSYQQHKAFGLGLQRKAKHNHYTVLLCSCLLMLVFLRSEAQSFNWRNKKKKLFFDWKEETGATKDWQSCRKLRKLVFETIHRQTGSPLTGDTNDHTALKLVM